MSKIFLVLVALLWLALPFVAWILVTPHGVRDPITRQGTILLIVLALVWLWLLPDNFLSQGSLFYLKAILIVAPVIFVCSWVYLAGFVDVSIDTRTYFTTAIAWVAAAGPAILCLTRSWRSRFAG